MTDTERITRLETAVAVTINYLNMHLNALGPQANRALQPYSEAMREFLDALRAEREA